MHPLIAAILKLRDLEAIAIRPQSPYHHQWLDFIDEQRQFIAELEAM
jgi:hypothetical protein